MMTRRTQIRLIAVAASLVMGCGQEDAGGSGVDDAIGEAATCQAGEEIRVVVLDIWGRRLDHWLTTINNEELQPDTDASAVIETPSTFTIAAGSPGYRDGSVTVALESSDSDSPSPESVSGNAGFAWSQSYGPGCRRFTLYIGLDHGWCASSGRPAWSGNRVDLLMDGEEFWSSVRADLSMAKRHVRGSTWWWQSDFELVRPPGHESMSMDQRRTNSILASLDATPAVKRLLLNRFLPDTASGMAYMNTDTEIRARALADGDGFEVILQGNSVQVPFSGEYEGTAPLFSFGERVQANPEFEHEEFPGTSTSFLLSTIDAASFHQKAFVIDTEVAYVSGMNVKSTDWDTNAHEVFESRRMKFASSGEERIRVLNKTQLPDLGPRKDYGIRVEGPAAREADDILKARWDLALDQGDMYWDHSTPFELEPRSGQAGDVTCQLVATMPPPIAEQSILETWAKALANAAGYIYIEDQYFRMPVLNSVILDTMMDRPWVTLVVVTKPVSYTDGGKKYTVESDNLFRLNAPDRYLLLQLKSFDAVGRPVPGPDELTEQFYFQDIDVHSKILIVDDVYLSVGSCNKNNRGVLYEGEMNVSVLDEGLVRDARRRIYRNLVGAGLAEQVSDDPDANFALLKAVASGNAEVEAYWRENGSGMPAHTVEAETMAHHPDGFVYPLSFTPEYLLEVGPDVF